MIPRRKEWNEFKATASKTVRIQGAQTQTEFFRNVFQFARIFKKIFQTSPKIFPPSSKQIPGYDPKRQKEPPQGDFLKNENS